MYAAGWAGGGVTDLGGRCRPKLPRVQRAWRRVRRAAPCSMAEKLPSHAGARGANTRGARQPLSMGRARHGRQGAQGWGRAPVVGGHAALGGRARGERGAMRGGQLGGQRALRARGLAPLRLQPRDRPRVRSRRAGQRLASRTARTASRFGPDAHMSILPALPEPAAVPRVLVHSRPQRDLAAAARAGRAVGTLQRAG